MWGAGSFVSCSDSLGIEFIFFFKNDPMTYPSVAGVCFDITRALRRIFFFFWFDSADVDHTDARAVQHLLSPGTVPKTIVETSDNDWKQWMPGGCPGERALWGLVALIEADYSVHAGAADMRNGDCFCCVFFSFFLFPSFYFSAFFSPLFPLLFFYSFVSFRNIEKTLSLVLCASLMPTSRKSRAERGSIGQRCNPYWPPLIVALSPRVAHLTCKLATCVA